MNGTNYKVPLLQILIIDIRNGLYIEFCKNKKNKKTAYA
jgi:hypothetical protein